VRSHGVCVVIEEDRFESGKAAYHAFCPALEGCHTWATLARGVIARLESGRTRPSTHTLERLAVATGTRLKISLEQSRTRPH